MEYRLTQNLLRKRENDFFEGVRAVLIDKDQMPKWSPPRLEDIDKKTLDEYFAPLEPGRELNLVPKVTNWSKL